MERTAIAWVGNKSKLVPYLKQVMPHHFTQYVEPFGGSGAVLLNMPPSKNRLDIYNDLNSDLVNLHLCIRDKPLALLRELGFLPLHSRSEFEFLRDFLSHEIYDANLAEEQEVVDALFEGSDAEELNEILKGKAELFDVYRAAAYFKRNRGSFSSTMTSFGVKTVDLRSFFYLILRESKRLENVVIENKNAIALIQERDKPDGVIYCDPPYYDAEQLYEADFSMEDHQKLADALRQCKGYVIVSYNSCPEVKELYSDFFIFEFARDNPMSQKKDSEYRELILTNYDARKYMAQMSLFDPVLTKNSKEFELVCTHVPDDGCELRKNNL